MTDMRDDILADSRYGYVAVVGYPDVDKSTLFNHTFGQELAITSRKPQTTRHNILGTRIKDRVQAVYAGMSDLHKNSEKILNRYMSRITGAALKDVDAVILVVDRTRWTEEGQMVLERVQYVSCPVPVAMNKTGRIEEKASLLSYLEWSTQRLPKAEVVSTSAQRGTNLGVLEKLVVECLPESEHSFPEGQITDHSSRFLVAKLVRERIMRQFGAKLSYRITAEIEEFEQGGRTLHIHALTLVGREEQKKITIGDEDERVESIGQNARKDMEVLPDSKVTFNLRVKVEGGRFDDGRALRPLGYSDFRPSPAARRQSGAIPLAPGRFAMPLAVAQVIYVPHSRPYEETSALVDLFAPLGRLCVVLRDARGKAGALVRPFMPLEAE